MGMTELFLVDPVSLGLVPVAHGKSCFGSNVSGCCVKFWPKPGFAPGRLLLAWVVLTRTSGASSL